MDFDFNQGLDSIVEGAKSVLSPQNQPPPAGTAPAGSNASTAVLNPPVDYQPYIIGAAVLLVGAAVILVASKK